MSRAPYGIYVHIPFCVRKCPYCDFNSYGVGTDEPALAEKYVEAVCAELLTYLRAPEFNGRTVQSIFFGGGTPSLLAPARIDKILSTIRDGAELGPEAEITLEANPGTVLEQLGCEKLSSLHELGINRISFGSQSFSPRKLRLLGRLHSPGDIRQALENAREAGFKQINCDLIFGIKDEVPEEWLFDLRQAVELRPEHISAYGLTIEPGTEFGRLAKMGSRMDADEELQASFFEETQQLLEGAGYLQYEVSNFAPAGNECRHNKNYWRRGEYIGAGAGAHGFMKSAEFPWGRRTINLPRTEHYIDRVAEKGTGEHMSEILTQSQAELEFLSLGLRTGEGISPAEYESLFGKKLFAEGSSGLERCERDGFLEPRGSSVRVTKKGLLFLNTVVERLAQALVLLLGLGILAVNAHAAPQEKIGAILPLTGDLADFGKPIREGMELAQKELGDEGFVLEFEDEQSMNRALTVSGAKRFVDLEKVSAVFNTAVNTIGPIAPLLNRAHTVGLVLWDSNKSLANQGDYIFGFGYATELAGEDLAEYAYKILALRNIAIIANVDEWSELIGGSFKERFESYGGKVPMLERLPVDSSDLRSVILKAKQLKADGIYAPLIGRSLSSWITQSKELRFEGARLTGDALGENELRQAGPEASAGIVSTQMFVQDPEFKRKYEAAYPEDQSSVRLGFVGLGYDAVRCLAQLKKKSGADPFAGEKVMSLLHSSKCEGITGTADFSNGQLSSKRERILRIEAGRFLPIR